MNTYSVKVRKSVTDYVVACVDVQAESCAAAIAKVDDDISAGVFEASFSFDQCGDTGPAEVVDAMLVA